MLSLAITACQSNPTEQAVVGKDESRFESLIQTEADASADKESINTLQPKDGTAHMPEVPDPAMAAFSMQDEFTAADSEIVVGVDVEGEYRANNYPVVRVRPKRLSMDALKSAAALLSSSDEYTEPKHESTKAEIEARLLALKRLMSDEDYLQENFKDDQAAKELYIAELEREVGYLEAAYQYAPEQDAAAAVDWTFHDSLYYQLTTYGGGAEKYDIDEMFIVDFPAALGNGRLQSVYRVKAGYYQVDYSYNVYSSIGDSGLIAWDTSLERPLTLSEDAAIEKADAVLRVLGAGTYRCTSLSRYGAAAPGSSRHTTLESDSDPVYMYSLTYLKSYNGADMLPMPSAWNWANTSEYGAQYEQEELRVTIINDEIHTIRWHAPLDDGDIENPDIAIMDFDSVYPLFVKQMQIEYTKGRISHEDPENGDYEQALARIKGGEVHVDEVLLGLVRIQIPNNYEEYRLVPAWSFRGTEYLDYGNGMYPGALGDETLIFQTINAVDGTYINVINGY